MKKFISILLALALVMGVFLPVAKAQLEPEDFRQHLNQYVSREYNTDDFFPPSIAWSVGPRVLNKIMHSSSAMGRVS